MNRSVAISGVRARALRTTGPVLAGGRLAIVILLLTVSPLALFMFDWQYADSGGGPIEKFHPATLLSMALVAWVAALNRNPLSGLIAHLRNHREMLPFLAANVLMMFYAGRVLGLPVTIFVDSYIGAALVYVLFRDLDAEAGRTLALLVHVLLFANALLGFYEVFSGTRLTPLVINGEELLDEPRATALLGHPLANAILVGGYIVILAVGGGRDLPVVLRPICFVVALASMVPFGGRAATAATIISLVFLGIQRFWAMLHGAQIHTRSILAGLLIGPVAGLALVAANEYGLLDTLTSRIFDDEGSASTRIEMFELFKYLAPSDLLFGPGPATLSTWVRIHGLEYGIESFLVAFILNYGLLAAIFFFPPLIMFLVALTRAARPGATIAIVYFMAVALTSISLSSKSPTLTIFVILLLILLRRNIAPARD